MAIQGGPRPHELTVPRAELFPAQGDPVLLPYLYADAADAERQLEAVLAEHVVPLLDRVIRQQLLRRGTFRHAQEEIEDVQGDAVADVLVRLNDLRDGFNPEPIANLAAYATVVARNACHRAIRNRRPNRARLKNRLRYLFSHDPMLALWQHPSGDWVCGLGKWRGKPATPGGQTRLSALIAHPGEVRQDASAGGVISEVGVVRAVARRLDGGVELDEMVEAVALVMGITDVAPAFDDGVPLADRLEAVEPSALEMLTEREALARLWSEILELPVRQRMALLLNLRGADGSGLLGLLPLMGIATLRAIAAALEMQARELATLWKVLPLEDARIAERLGLTRQQVINLRKSARERLARRLDR
jgi:RNA polymerase sigma factor (sigma-70 family)